MYYKTQKNTIFKEDSAPPWVDSLIEGISTPLE